MNRVVLILHIDPDHHAVLERLGGCRDALLSALIGRAADLVADVVVGGPEGAEAAHRRRRADLLSMLVAPGVVVLADVAHLDLIRIVVARGVGEATPLEALYQHVGLAAAHARPGPVWFGQRIASDEDPVGRGDQRRDLARQIVPEDIGDVMPHHVSVARITAVVGIVDVARRCQVLAHRAGGVECSRHQLVGTIWRTAHQAPQRLIGWRRAAGIARDRDIGRQHGAVEIRILPDLNLTGHHLVDQPAVGHVPNIVRVAGRIVDLHAALIEIGDKSLVVRQRRVGIRLGQHMVRLRSPEPGAVDRAVGHCLSVRSQSATIDGSSELSAAATGAAAIGPSADSISRTPAISQRNRLISTLPFRDTG